MQHLNGISEEQYIYGINAAWALYKKLQYNFPEQFLNYVAKSKFKYRLSYNKNEDRWYMLKLTFPNGIIKSNQQQNENDTKNTNKMQHSYKPNWNYRNNCTMRYLLQRQIAF